MKTWIYKYQFEQLENQIDKLNKKAEKLGVPKITFEETGNYKRKKITAYRNQYGQYSSQREYEQSYSKEEFEKLQIPTALIEVEIKGELPVYDNHVVVAEIDHSRRDTGEYENIITPFAFASEDQELISNMVFNTYKNHAPDCEHCGMNRRRNKTFAVMNQETMNVSQIASKCLEDYIPKMTLSSVLFSSESSKFVSELTMDEEFTGSVYPQEWFIETQLAVALSAYATKNFGFKGSKDPESTKSRVLDAIRGVKSTPDEMRSIISDYDNGRSNRWLDDADKIINSFRNSTSEQQYEHNLRVAINREFVQAKGARWGLINSAANHYYENNRTLDLADEHFMNEKDRGLIKFTVIKVKESSYDDAFMNNFLTMVTDSGHQLHFKQYFPSSLDELKVDKTYIAKGTVKKHDINRKGQKVTYLARLNDLKEVSKDEPVPSFKPVKKARKKKEQGLEI